MFLPQQLTTTQKRILAEFLANLSVGWFVASIVTPLLDTRRIPVESIFLTGIGLALSVMLLNWSLIIAKDLE